MSTLMLFSNNFCKVLFLCKALEKSKTSHSYFLNYYVSWLFLLILLMQRVALTRIHRTLYIFDRAAYNWFQAGMINMFMFGVGFYLPSSRIIDTPQIFICS